MIQAWTPFFTMGIWKMSESITLPETEGWYWYRQNDQSSWIVWEVIREFGLLWATHHSPMVNDRYDVRNHRGEWVGPLLEPVIQSAQELSEYLNERISGEIIYEQLTDMKSDDMLTFSQGEDDDKEETTTKED